MRRSNACYVRWASSTALEDADASRVDFATVLGLTLQRTANKFSVYLNSVKQWQERFYEGSLTGQRRNGNSSSRGSLVN